MSYFREDILRMHGYVPGEQPRGGKIIKLNTNENPYPPSPAVGRAITAALSAGLSKYPDPLATAFRVRAGEVLGVPPEWILCGNGSDDILTIVTRAFVGQGQIVRALYPSYLLYHTLAQIQGARLQQVTFNADWSLPDEFGQPLPDLRLAFLANPNSPSGTVIAPEQVLDLAERLPCPLLVDEAYVDFAQTDCLDLVRRCDRVLVSRSMSKSYSLAGLRFGFLVAQRHLIEHLLKVKDSYNCDSLSIAGATAAIDDQAWLAQTRQKILASRAALEAGLRRLGFEVTPSQANFVWCQHPGRPARPLYEQLKQQGVLVRYMDYPPCGDGLRITVGTEEQLDVLLNLLEAALR